MQKEQYFYFLHLCSQLHAHCRLQHWYGSDYQNGRWNIDDELYDRSYTADGTEIIIERDISTHQDLTQAFAFPPATETQIQETEMTLGFPLPPFLRVVYTHVANGGFGPGHGLMGAIGGFDEAGNIVTGYRFHSTHSELIDLAAASSIEKTEILRLSDKVWPRFLLYLCDWGEATTSCIDALTGRVFRHHPAREDHYYMLEPEASSLEAWLIAWMNGQLQPAVYVAGAEEEKQLAATQNFFFEW